jgi:purine-nucleoside phosphorylase
MTTVQGHAGKFVFGQIGPQKTPVALLVGRAQLVDPFHVLRCVTQQQY